MNFKGCGVALVTPFRKGAVDFTALKRLVNHQIKNGADFLCILATTGETPCLTAGEKREIKECVVEWVKGRVPIVMGCGGNNTTEVVETLLTEDWSGIDGVLSVCPYYNKPTQEGLYQHFRAIAAASPLPVILYNVPGRTGVNLKAETTLRLAREYDNIVAVKEASGNMEQIEEILRGRPEGFDVLSGDDVLTADIMDRGGVGAISVVANAYPRLYNSRNIGPLCDLLFADGNPAGIKALLHQMGMIENELRLPLVPATQRTYDLLSKCKN